MTGHVTSQATVVTSGHSPSVWLRVIHMLVIIKKELGTCAVRGGDGEDGEGEGSGEATADESDGDGESNSGGGEVVGSAMQRLSRQQG